MIMNGNHNKITRLVFTLALALGLATNGCQHQRDYGMKPASNPIQDEFSAGKDRAPTAQTLYAMSRLLTARHRDAQAEYVLMRIIEKHPDFVPAYVDLAELQMRKNMTDEAMATLRKGMEVAPGNALLKNNLGVCLMVTEDYAGALEQFTAASQAEPRERRYSANRGVAMALMGEYDQALEIFKGALTHEDAHYNLAMICQANGDEARAAEELRLSKQPHRDH